MDLGCGVLAPATRILVFYKLGARESPLRISIDCLPLIKHNFLRKCWTVSSINNLAVIFVIQKQSIDTSAEIKSLPCFSCVQGYLAHKKLPPRPQNHHRALGIGLLQGPRGGQFIMGEVPL